MQEFPFRQVDSFLLDPDIFQQPCQFRLQEQMLFDLLRTVLRDQMMHWIQKIADILQESDIEVFIIEEIKTIVIPDRLQIGICQFDCR